ncbi:hypothetical protein EYZ11_000761 [Aspergillus tanneri]|uniref:Uncharacterized protein n=1 Tax=Aspergillus tanneri TaxID=1220188 RepID=A0A4S3JW77_9EURO|nr:hypothetical protein EYZ11_000761 [Aspergillus tanneri]
MSSGAKAKPEGLLGLSLAEAKAILLGLLCMDEGGKASKRWSALAQRGGYKNGASAGTSYRAARRKLNEYSANFEQESLFVTTNTEAAPISAANTPKKTPGKRNKAAADIEGADNEKTESPKSKRQRKTPVKKGAAAKLKGIPEENEDQDMLNHEADAEDSKKAVNVKTEDDGLMARQEIDADSVMGEIDIDVELEAMESTKTSTI